MKATKILRKARLGSTHWGRRIIAAEKRGRFRRRQKDDACSWVTCACGKLDGISRGSLGIPLDKDLQRLGHIFTDSVAANRFTKAAEALIAIEKRADQLAKKKRGRK